MKQPSTFRPASAPPPPMGSVDTATLELLATWKAEDATTDPEKLREADEEIAEFKKAIALAIRSTIPSSSTLPRPRTAKYSTLACVSIVSAAATAIAAEATPAMTSDRPVGLDMSMRTQPAIPRSLPRC